MITDSFSQKCGGSATIMNENGRNNLSGPDYAYSVPRLPVLLRYGVHSQGCRELALADCREWR